MQKYGNYNTFDCPKGKDKKETEERIQICYNWLEDVLDKVGGCEVLQIINKHELGDYPSFEIFMPSEYEYIPDEEDKMLIRESQACYKALHKIEKDYYMKFSKWL